MCCCALAPPSCPTQKTPNGRFVSMSWISPRWGLPGGCTGVGLLALCSIHHQLPQPVGAFPTGIRQHTNKDKELHTTRWKVGSWGCFMASTCISRWCNTQHVCLSQDNDAAVYGGDTPHIPQGMGVAHTQGVAHTHKGLQLPLIHQPPQHNRAHNTTSPSWCGSQSAIHAPPPTFTSHRHPTCKSKATTLL